MCPQYTLLSKTFFSIFFFRKAEVLGVKVGFSDVTIHRYSVPIIPIQQTPS